MKRNFVKQVNIACSSLGNKMDKDMAGGHVINQ